MFTMTRLVKLRQLGTLTAITAALLACTVSEARAQGFFSPFIGYDYGGDSLCQALRGCEEKNLNVGFSFGKLGKAGGFEQEFAWAKNFFGKGESGADSNVLTIMSNLMIAPKIGPVRPYGLFGVGFMKAHVDLNPIKIVTFTNNTFAWDAGAGVMVLFGQHVGVRGDFRHFNSFQGLDFIGIGGDTKLAFGRVSAALVLAY